MTEKQKPPLSATEAEEKDKLKSFYLEKRPVWAQENGRKLTQELLGQLVGELIGSEKPITQGAIWQYLNKTSNTKLNADFVQALATILGFDPTLVSKRFGPIYNATVQANSRSDPVTKISEDHGAYREPLLGDKRVPELDVNAKLGPGNEFQNGDVIQYWPVSERELILAQAEFPVIITVTGQSMEPKMQDGDKVLINHEIPRSLDGKVYLLDGSKGTQVKRVNMLNDETIRIVSDNPDKETFPTIEMTPEEFEKEYSVRGTVVQRMRWERIS